MADRLPADRALPVDVYTPEDLRTPGAFDFLDTMRDVAPSIWVPQESIQDLRSGIRPFQLRGLSPDHTRVLVNGVPRRSSASIQVFGQSMPGSSGVDLNAIPRLALKRVELLRGGASARHGSGAVAGVVNLELRDEVSPLDVEVNAGKHVPDWFRNDGWKGRVAAHRGFEVPRVGGVLNLTAEYLRRTATSRAGASSRDQLERGDGDELADVDDDPLLEVVQKNNPVPQPTFHFGDGFYENRMLWANYERALGEGEQDGELYLMGAWSDRTDRHSDFRRRGLEDRNWPEIDPLGFLPTFDADTRDVQVAAGLRGRWSEWDYDVTASFGQNRVDVTMTNTLNTSLGPSLTEALAPGPDGELGTDDDPGIPNSRSFYAGAVESGEYTARARVNRPIDVGLQDPLTLSAGVRVGAENYRIRAGEPGSWIHGGHPTRGGGFPVVGAQGFTGWRGPLAERFEIGSSDESDEWRTSGGAHVAAEADVTESVLLSAAVRLEHYEEVGAASAAELDVLWRPLDPVVVRLSGGTGFRVPGLAQEQWKHVGVGFTSHPQFPVEIGEYPVDSPPARALGARPLEEERTRHVSGGAAWTPLDGLELSADGYYARIHDGAVLSRSLGAEVVQDLLSDVRAVSVRFTANALELEAYGGDLDARYERRWSEDHAVALSARFHLGRVSVVDEETPAPLAEIDEDFLEPETIDLIESRRPAETGLAMLRYRRAGVEATLRGHVFGSTTELVDRGLGDEPDVFETWPAKATLDAEVGYRFANGLRVSVGGDNLTDAMPAPNPDLLGEDPGSFDNIFWPGSPYPWMNGRYLYVSAEWSLD